MDNLRRGILLFTAFLFVAITVIGFVLALNYYDTAAEKERVPNWNYDGEVVVNQADNAAKKNNNNVLVIIGDKGAEHSDLMFVANYDAEKKGMSFVYIPKDMQYSVEANSIPSPKKSYSSSYNIGTVSQLYSRFKGEDTVKIVSYMLDISIDRYLYLSFNDCEKLFNGFTLYEKDGLYFDMPVSVSNENLGISIEIKKDKDKWFDGKTAVELMRFYQTADGVYDNELLKYYDGTDLKRIDMVQKLTETFIKTQFFGSNSSKDYYIKNFYDIAYKKVISSCETNIDDAYVNNFQSVLGSIEPSSISFYVLKCDTAKNNSLQYVFTDCLYDYASAKVLTADDSKAVLNEKF